MRAIVAGTPGSEVLLDRVADDLRAHGWEVRSFYGESLAAVDPARWAEAEVLVCYGIPLGAAELKKASKLRGIVSPTIGYEWIDEDAASALGILIANGAVPQNQESMAEAAILLLLAALYDLPGAEAELRGAARKRIPPRMLQGKCVGLLGYGNIAQAIVDRLQGWGAEFVVHRRSKATADDRVEFVPLDTLLERSDILIVLTSLNSDSRRLIDAAALDRLKRGAILINVSRGGIVDEDALAERLADGRLSMAALDVFEEEPLPATSPLRRVSNAILTPHALGHTLESFAAIPGVAVENALALGRWAVPASTRNAEIAARWRTRE